MADQNTTETKTTTAPTAEELQAAFIEKVDVKAQSLKEQYGNVLPMIITDDDGEKVVGFFQKPEFDTIMYCTDQILAKQVTMAAEQALKNCLLVDESDPRIVSSLRKDAYIKAAFTMAALKMIKPYVDEYKKNNRR